MQGNSISEDWWNVKTGHLLYELVNVTIILWLRKYTFVENKFQVHLKNLFIRSSFQNINCLQPWVKI